MAIGFALMWLTGVLVTNVEGVPYFVDEDRQGVIRDLHKSIGLTLLALLIVRLGMRLLHASPPLPAAIPQAERRVAHAGHVALYVTIVIACVTGFAIADLHEYGNAYFGIELPQIFPTSEWVAGWAATPWSYILHAIFAYGLLALVVGHVAAVWLHARAHRVDLLPRVLSRAAKSPGRMLVRLSFVGGSVLAVVVIFAIRGFVTLGPQEEPRDYRTTTPFFKPIDAQQ
ncbi:Cytochrome B561 [plant metagenome]|uniref:Cytochrome B561 n=1 Tax=plant metagenome TaxID=1297885 RepID=A0A484SHA8_9ZZZZ